MAQHSPADAGREFARLFLAEIASMAKGRTGRALSAEQASELEALAVKLAELAFDTSLEKEEGRFCHPSFLFPLGPDAVRGELVRFSRPIPLTADSLRKLSGLCVAGSVFLLVEDGAELCITGTCAPRWSNKLFTLLTDTTLRFIVSGPGSFSIGRGQREYVRYEHGQIADVPAALDERVLVELGRHVFGAAEAEERSPFLADVFARILENLRALDAGGIIAICAEGESPASAYSEARELEIPLSTQVLIQRVYCTAGSPPLTMNATADDLRRALEDRNAEEKLFQAERALARFASLDGAVVLTHKLELVAFSAKLNTSATPLSVRRVNEKGELADTYPLADRGNRHRAAASFVAANPSRLALLLSQDGAATAFISMNDELAAWPIHLGWPDGSRLSA